MYSSSSKYDVFSKEHLPQITVYLGMPQMRRFCSLSAGLGVGYRDVRGKHGVKTETRSEKTLHS